MEVSKNNKSQNLLFVFFISIFVFYCILFPRDKMNLKQIFLVGAIFTCYSAKNVNFRVPVSVFALGFIYPVLCIAYGLLRGSTLASAISFSYVWLIILVFPGIQANHVSLIKPFILGTYTVALIIDLIMLMDLTGIASIYSNPIALLFKQLGELQGLGKGALSTFGYSIFYKTCPLIIVSYCYFISKKKYFLAFPLLLALFGCGTRANFLVALFATAVLPVLNVKRKKYKIWIFIFICALTILVLPEVFDMMTNLNSLKSGRSDIIKIKDMFIVFDILFSNIFDFLFGTGVGSGFMSYRGEFLRTFELSYIDYFRQTGLVGFIVLLTFIIRPIKWLYLNEKWLFVGYICYLLVSFTNPLLVTSTSFVLYLLVYSKYLQREKKVIQ